MGLIASLSFPEGVSFNKKDNIMKFLLLTTLAAIAMAEPKLFRHELGSRVETSPLVRHDADSHYGDVYRGDGYGWDIKELAKRSAEPEPRRRVVGRTARPRRARPIRRGKQSDDAHDDKDIKDIAKRSVEPEPSRRRKVVVRKPVRRARPIRRGKQSDDVHEDK